MKVLGWNADGNALVNLDPSDTTAAVLFAELHYQQFTGDGVSTSFNLAYPPTDLPSTNVSVDGLVLTPLADFDISGSAVTFTTPPSNGAEVLVRYGKAASSEPPERITYRFVATEGQTVFTLAGGYPNGRNALTVYVNGIRLETGGVDFVETSATTVTLNAGLYAGTSVVFVVGAEGASVSSVYWADVTGKPSTFVPSTHLHAIADVVNLQSVLNNKADFGHTHTVANVTGLQTALDAKQATLVSGANIRTINGNSLLGSGDIALAGGAGDASGISYSNAFTSLAATNVQGAITELDIEKQPLLVSGFNLRTVNGNSLLGSGNIAVSGTAASTTFTPAGNVVATNVQAAIQELDTEKQATLVSGTNIKTINGTSLLGSGNVTISGGGTLDAAAIATALTSTSASKNWIWNSDIPGSVNAGPQQCIYLQRNAVYDNTAGLSGGVVSALYVETFTPTGTHNLFEWGITSALHSRSISSIIPSGPLAGFASPQNVAINGTVFRDAGNAPIWGGNFVAYHEFNEFNTTRGAMHGVEINVGGNGVDTGEQSIGVYVVPQLRSSTPGPGVFEGWTGVLVQGSGAASARWRNGITNRGGRVFGYIDEGTHAVAIDLSTSTNSSAALRIKANDWIALEATGTIKFRYNSGNSYIEFFNGATRRGFINLASGSDSDLAAGGGSTPSNMVTTDTVQTITALKTFTGGVSANGILVDNGVQIGANGTIGWSSTGNVTYSATGGFATLPANAQGFLRVVIDGTSYKVPYYNN